MHPRTFSLQVLILGLGVNTLPGAWSDRTAGLPPIEILTAKDIGASGSDLGLTVDTLGRVFVGSRRLSVFDGQSWQTFAKPNEECLYSLAASGDGKIWAGGANELGYFTEEQAGAFQFHSLLNELPPSERDIGIVWGCTNVGQSTYFICRDRILKWGKGEFVITLFPTDLRLVPLKLGNEFWFFHRETGLYRMTENGAKLEIPASELKHTLVMGLYRDESGIVAVGNQGFVRPGNPTQLLSEDGINHYLEKHVVSAFVELADGNLAIGTLSGGILLASRSGKLIRTWDSNSGLPGHDIMNLVSNSAGDILGLTSTAFFQFPANGGATIYNSTNGLTGETVNYLTSSKSKLFAATANGIFHLDGSALRELVFRKTPEANGLFSYILPHHDGLLLGRFGGVDQYNGTSLKSIYREFVGDASLIRAARKNPRLFYVAESYGLAQLSESTDGDWVHHSLTALPDACTSMFEDRTGRLWMGTATKGGFIYDPSTDKLTPIRDPINGSVLQGLVTVLGNDQEIILLHSGGVLRADAENHALIRLNGFLPIVPIKADYAPGGRDILISYESSFEPTQISTGLGILSREAVEHITWRELDIPSLQAIGRVRCMTLTEENNRSILWLGGTEGILRLDYDGLLPLRPPPTPTVRFEKTSVALPGGQTADSFPFKNHHVRLMVFTGDYVRGKDWFIQTRLDEGDWSNTASRRSFEYTNLSEGRYRFEARTINSAGMASASTALDFTILPPWYRSGGAYTGYSAGLALCIFGFIRLRERRIHRRNRELETLVARRTDELVKANAAKDEFLASVSHEIRNPMNGVIGIAESFKTESLDPESRHKFHLLRQCASHLSSLLEDLLDFSRVQAGAVELESKPFDLAELLASVTALSSAASEKRGIPVEIALAPNMPRQLTGDQRRVRQILLNFVNNALNFSNHGQVSVTVWCKTAGPRLTEVFFAVTDEGPGISPEEQKKLFTRFERGTAAKHARVPGTGLGLALCRSLAEQMGGRIWLESELGAGSSFYFSAPFETAEAPTRPQPLAPLSGHLQCALVVDDEEYNRIALADLLESLGFSVQNAADGPEALGLAGRSNFDVIFLDCAMPGLTGPEVARAIRALPNRSAQALVFAVTAFNTPDKRAQCLAAGMDGFLGKPINMERLRQALAACSTRSTPATPPGPAGTMTDDPYARLQLLAAKKHITLSEELSLFLRELEHETAQLIAATLQKSAREAEHFAHLLCGRAGFVGEAELALILRKIGQAAASGQWAEAVALSQEVETRVAALQVRLVSAAPVAPPA